MFYRKTGFHTGYIGSSNLSRSALTNGLEWNIKVTTNEVKHLIDKFQKTFDTYWQDKEFELFDKTKHVEKLRRALRKEQPNGPIATDHGPRKRNIKRTFLAALRSGNMQDASTKIEVFKLGVLQSSRPRATEQKQEMKLAANEVFEGVQLFEPTEKIGRSHACVSARLRIPING